MKIFLDDIRDAPNGWVIVRNYADCIKALETGNVTYLSLDHDLGTLETGYDVAVWIEEKVWKGELYPPIIEVHSANPVGRKKIDAAIKSIKRAMTVVH